MPNKSAFIVEAIDRQLIARNYRKRPSNNAKPRITSSQTKEYLIDTSVRAKV